MSRYHHLLPAGWSLRFGVTCGDEEDVSPPVTVVPLGPVGDEPGEDDPSTGEGDPFPAEGVGESLAVGDVPAVGDGLGPGAGVGLGSGSGVVSGLPLILKNAGTLVALTVWLLMN